MSDILAGLDESAIDHALQTGQAVTGGFDGPMWRPTLNPRFNPDTKEEALRAKLEKSGKGSSWAPKIIGTLVAAHAWGRRLYFLDVTPKGAERPIRVMLPESKLLYNGLNLCQLGATVAIELTGKGKPARPGRAAPWLYRVVSVGTPALAEPRTDSLQALSMDEREALKAARDGGGVDPESEDADLPF